MGTPQQDTAHFKIENKPGRVLKLVNQIPAWMYRHHLGFLLRERFALVVHRGRKSGIEHPAIVETADGSVAEGRVVYVAAWGRNAQWVLNLEHSGAVSIEIGGKVYVSPRHEFLACEETERAIASYWTRYPRIAAFLASNKHYPYPGPVGTYPGAPVAVAFYLK